MASKSLEKPKKQLWLTYDEEISGGQAKDPEDRWTDHEDTDIEFSLRRCYGAAERVPVWLRERVDLDFDVHVGDQVYVVVVRYGTGGTFGHTNGAWYIEGGVSAK
jgi:hypothetical protein